MTQNLTRPSKSKKRPRYSRTNPPANRDMALGRLDTLNEEIPGVETKLDHTYAESFPNDEAYEDWRRRAMLALQYMRQEKTFLEQWLVGDRVPSQPLSTSERERYQNLQLIATRIQSRAQQLADEIDADYVTKYSVKKEPESIDAAEERIAELIGVKQRLQAAFAEINAQWTSHPLRRENLPGIKAPLQKILSQVEIELAVVRKYLKTQGVAKAQMSANWKEVCVAALQRAVNEGFTLTDEELSTLEHLQASIHSG